MNFTQEEIQQIENHGLTIETVEKQIKNFETDFPPLSILNAAKENAGITILKENEEDRYVEIFENALSSGLNVLKFVPASGAASRMFKNLYSFLDQATDEAKANEIAETDAFMNTFFSNLEKFAFYPKLPKTDSKIEIVKYILEEDGLNYGQLPKGQLDFHKYKELSRTSFEEHLVESATYGAGKGGGARIHFTVSPNHQAGFEEILKANKATYQKRYGVTFDVTFSHQKKSTDTIAVDLENKPFKDRDGKLVFRPGGHGALIENLNDLEADLIFIKNIDNVVPDHLKAPTKKYKKALAGLIITLRNKIFTYLEKLDKPEIFANDELLHSIEVFLKKELFIEFNANFGSVEEKVEFFKTKLNRPIRVCGMVKNDGEPGGGPFVAKNNDGTASLQIAEKAQIDLNNEAQEAILNESTHFNPVDLVCVTRNYKGENFDLLNYIDEKTGFISLKSLDGKDLKALELPGLWNGAMSDWNTVFVEVPTITFNPVKTVNDLLRPEHQ